MDPDLLAQIRRHLEQPRPRRQHGRRPIRIEAADPPHEAASGATLRASLSLSALALCSIGIARVFRGRLHPDDQWIVDELVAHLDGDCNALERLARATPRLYALRWDWTRDPNRYGVERESVRALMQAFVIAYSAAQVALAAWHPGTLWMEPELNEWYHRLPKARRAAERKRVDRYAYAAQHAIQIPDVMEHWFGKVRGEHMWWSACVHFVPVHDALTAEIE